MDLNKAAAALEAFGFLAYNSSRGLVIHVPDKRKRLRWKEGRQHGYVETLVRAAVLNVAPASYASPVQHEEAPTTMVRLVVRPFPPHASATVFVEGYTSAWIAAAILLHENGLAAPYEVKER